MRHWKNIVRKWVFNLRIIKTPSKDYPNLMSRRVTLWRSRNLHIDIQEYYGSVHYLSINKWVRDKDGSGLLTLRKWKHIPLDSYTRKILKEDKSYKIPGNIRIISQELKRRLNKR